MENRALNEFGKDQQRPKKIFQIVPGDQNSNIPVFISTQIKSLASLGFEVQVFVFQANVLFRNPLRLMQRLYLMRQEIRAFNPDIIHAQFGSLLGFSTSLIKPPQKPFVLSLRGSDINPTPSEPGWKQSLRQFFSRIAADRADVIICVSKGLSDHLSIRNKNKVQIIPSGVNTKIFHPLDMKVCRKEIGWNHDDPVMFFYQGKSPKVKRRDIADAVFAKAKQTIPNLKIFVCSGEYSQAKLSTYLNACNLVLMVSDYEGSPNIVREAVSCGVYVLSVDVGDVTEWINHPKRGQIVSKDIEKISSALVTFIEKPSITSNVEKQDFPFSLSKTTHKLISLYDKLC